MVTSTNSMDVGKTGSESAYERWLAWDTWRGSAWHLAAGAVELNC